MNYNTDIIIKTDSDVKQETQEIFEALGLDIGTAVNIFLRQVIIHHGLPFSVMLEPNDITVNAINNELHGPFNSVEELMKALNE
ncbi:MAG: type II toxin-antitoxin system RelB/DinJ family antitoxin [Synergistales bacterium]|nr:type II toxin-antitoxin system RelB/DinJ family antitoxin [Synergistales bacterium]MDY6401608.1 type II toxin-antitoxin system RelB/DinJ family antitoxin [Synergistales bacterium]MDY6404304.1 type II toxin-antitoxin system RelB/DinJ family antitoxin [Synergistales bacterium]MDY6410682.1 type II toxin-antitoxin system RelB/DinJ family antitoxin [Synergistales bacterium]MDY6414005.1 type II toxin-antitoxin system RelB/DinJ family antitoxin [Synergistales bacterium]